MRISLCFVVAETLLALCLSSPAASVLWRQTIDGGAPDEGMGVKTDAAGNVYVAAMTYLPPRAWLSLVKLDEAGAEQWRTEIPVGTAAPPKSGSCQIVVVEGDTYVACHEDAADHGAFVTRCRADGSVAWRETCAEIAWPAVFTTDGNAAYLAGTNGVGELVLKKFTETGTAWTLPVTNATITNPFFGGDVVVTSNDVFITGWQSTDEIDLGTLRVKAAFILRCSAEGNLLWRRTLTSTNRLNSLGMRLAQLTDESIVMFGSQFRFATNGPVEFATDLFLRFDTDGNELVRTTGTGVPQAIVPLPGGDMLTVASGERIRVSRVSANGIVQWVRAIGPIRGISAVTAMRFDSDGRLLLGGWRGFKNLFLSEVNIDTGKLRNRKFAIPRASRYGRYDFGIDGQSNFYFLGGDGTPWPDVILTKFRGFPP